MFSSRATVQTPDFAETNMAFLPRVLVLALGLFAASTATVPAQVWPQKPVRVVVPNAAGSLSDTLSRMVFARVSETLGQQFFIDDRPGAGGSIGAEIAAKSPTDGYTVLVAANGIMVINPFLYSKLGYDPLRDFAPVSMLAKVSEVLIVNSSLGVRSMDEFVRLAKSRPGQIHYSSGGNGHATHLMMELFLWKAGLQLVHVPYKGTTPAMQAVVSGEVGAYAIGAGLAQPHVQTGKVVALATIGPRTAEVLPGVPALSTFYPDAEVVNWQAVFVPAGTSAQIVEKLNATIVKALESSDLKARLSKVGLTATASSPAELDAIVRTDQAVNRELVKRIGLKLD